MSGVAVGIFIYLAISLSGWAIVHGAKKSAERQYHD